MSAETTPLSGQGSHHDHGWLSLDWGEPVGACWDVFRSDPCCSDGNCCYCCCCWMFCGLCTTSKLFATSVRQDCAVLNHCLPMYIFAPCMEVCMRHNLRRQRKVGETGSAGWIGDCCLLYWCGPCAVCQMIRSVPVEGWDWYGQCKRTGIVFMVDPCQFVLNE